MKKIYYPLFAVVLVLALIAPVLADTIRLKDGSVIRGEVIGFKDQRRLLLRRSLRTMRDPVILMSRFHSRPDPIRIWVLIRGRLARQLAR